MEHHFELPVHYKGEEKVFSGRLVTFAYEYKFYINVNSQELVYEYDDEQNIRAVAYDPASKDKADPELVALIGQKLTELRTAMIL